MQEGDFSNLAVSSWHGEPSAHSFWGYTASEQLGTDLKLHLLVQLWHHEPYIPGQLQQGRRYPDTRLWTSRHLPGAAAVPPPSTLNPRLPTLPICVTKWPLSCLSPGQGSLNFGEAAGTDLTAPTALCQDVFSWWKVPNFWAEKGGEEEAQDETAMLLCRTSFFFFSAQQYCTSNTIKATHTSPSGAQS